MKIIMGKAGAGKSTELLKKFGEVNNGVYITGNYEISDIKTIAQEKLGTTIEKLFKGEKIFFKLEKISADAMAYSIVKFIENGAKNIFIDDVHCILTKSEQGIADLLRLEKEHEMEFIFTVQLNHSTTINENTPFGRNLQNHAHKITMIKV